MRAALRLFCWAIVLGWIAVAGVVGLIDLWNPFFNDVPEFAGLGLLGLVMWRSSRAFVFISMLGGASWLASSRMPDGPVPTRLVVYGVDGATFDVIDKHELPAFARLAEEGTRAELTSMEPMFSPILWTTMASGRTADEHGIRGFRVQADECRVARWWDVAESAGMSVGLYKWLVDYPPRQLRHGGFWVPSWLAAGPETWPAHLGAVKEIELSKRLRRKQVAARSSAPVLAMRLVGAGVRLSTLARAVRWSYAERYEAPGEDRRNVEMQTLRGWVDRDVFIRQLHANRPDVASFTYYATDGLSHLYWDRYDAGGDEVMTAYRQADTILADIRAALAPEARFIVVSDHGFREMDGTGLAGQFAPLTERLRARLAEVTPEVDVSRLGHKLVVATKDAGGRAAVEVFLRNLTDADGAPVYRLAEVPGSAFSLGLTLSDESVTAERLASDTVGGEPLSKYVELTEAYTGTHDPRGIFYAAGPGVTRGGKLDPVSLLQVAPTILAALALPAAENMPGRAVIFPEVPRVPTHDALLRDLVWLTVDRGVNEEALEALGYIQGDSGG